MKVGDIFRPIRRIVEIEEIVVDEGSALWYCDSCLRRTGRVYRIRTTSTGGNDSISIYWYCLECWNRICGKHEKTKKRDRDKVLLDI